jgi:hypothetical protein
MSKIIRILIVTLLISMFLTSTVLADGNCPPGFMLHMAHEHDEHHTGHLHAGTDADQNGDGFICVKHVTASGNIHVHIDNNLP